MLLSWAAEGNLRWDGLNKRILKDGRTCLLWAKGYFFDASGHMRFADEILDWLDTQLGTYQLSDIVPGMNGCFSVIVVWPEAKVIEAANDRFGTIPIYYHINDKKLVMSDNFWETARGVSSVKYDPDAVMSMVLLGYVTGYQTLLKGIKELPQAATHSFSFVGDDLKLVSQRYWMFSYHLALRGNLKVWREQLALIVQSIFYRYSQAILERGWDPHIPLSGGKDSRLLVGMFRQNKVPIWAFSYGPPGNIETQYASQVAAALGIPFRFEPVNGPFCLTPSLIQTMTTRIGAYARFTAGLGGELSRTAFDNSTVYIPGHTGDFVTGGHLRRGGLLVCSETQAIRHLIDIHLLPVFDEMTSILFHKNWNTGIRAKVISNCWHFDTADPTGSIDRWDCENRQRRLIISELRTYEQSGHWMLPFYDYNLFDFFAKVPIELRYQQSLYIDTLVHNIFINDLAFLAEIPIAHQGILHQPTLSWRDWVLIRKPVAVFDDWILKRATDTKRREHLQSICGRSTEPSGPDPIDHWWYDYPAFRQSLIDTFNDWDGMSGIIDVDVLLKILQQPLPRLFVQFIIPAFLTLYYFQKITAHEINSSFTRYNLNGA